MEYLIDFSLNETQTTNIDHMNTMMINSNTNLSTIAPNDNSNNTHHLVSTNSFEITATSLSDDSGLPHTNSSISSGSSRIGLCKLEYELAESDGEVSQFDSLDNCSDGGMNTENFNTLKKGPLTTIEPPPEFQDSPQTTLLRSQLLQNYALRLVKNIITNAYTQLPYNNQQQPSKLIQQTSTKNLYFNSNRHITAFNNYNTKDFINKNSYQMYASDSILNRYIINNDYDYDSNNIYDELNCDKSNIDINQKKIKTIKNKITSDHLYELNQVDIHINNSNNTNKCILDTVQRKKLTQQKTILYSPLHHHPGSNLSTINRPNSRNSLNSRLSSSHNSLSVTTANKADDSIFITQAMSHDEITDFYNVPIDSDIYALPIDVIKTPDILKIIDIKNLNSGCSSKNLKTKLKYTRNNNKKRRRTNNNNTNSSNTNNVVTDISNDKYNAKVKLSKTIDKRHSVPENTIEPMHMTLDEVKRYYHSLYSSSSDSCETINKNYNNNLKKKIGLHNNYNNNNNTVVNNHHNRNDLKQQQNNKVTLNNKTPINILKTKKKLIPLIPTKETIIIGNNISIKSSVATTTSASSAVNTTTATIPKKSQFSINLNLKQKFCSIFRFRKTTSTTVVPHNNTNNNNMNNNININNNNNNNNKDDNNEYGINRNNIDITQTTISSINNITTTTSFATEYNNDINYKDKKVKFSTRALPPLPEKDGNVLDFPANIEKVKECGWYWGPISSEAAEKILSNEPDGSFIVRDSSDDHYIFSLTFKLSGCIRHVRIEQDQGEFSFGSRALFKSRTITEFIENAVEHSRSGRYLFFLHRRPEHGPMRVQLTNPVSRFRHIQSLQHMCRFAILKVVVRKDLIQNLPLPRRLLDYLSYKNCYSEQVDSDSSQSQISVEIENS